MTLKKKKPKLPKPGLTVKTPDGKKHFVPNGQPIPDYLKPYLQLDDPGSPPPASGNAGSITGGSGGGGSVSAGGSGGGSMPGADQAYKQIRQSNENYNLTNPLPGLNTGGFNFGAAPNYGQMTFTNSSANPMFGDLYQQATQGSINSFDTAANRLRERLEASGQAQRQSFQNRSLGMGQGASGLMGRGLQSIDQANQFAYGQGLSSLADAFEQQRLQGLGIANQAAANLSQEEMTRQQLQGGFQEAMNSILSGDYQKLQELGLDKAQFMDEIMEKMRKNRADDMLQRELGRGGLVAGGGNDGLLQDLYARLEELLRSGE